MRKLFALLPLALAVMAGPVFAAPEIGKQAPDFTAVDASGNPFKLSDHKGKIVVLEWTNHDCPYVIKHYDTGNMQKTQDMAREAGAAWVTIVSSAPGNQGHVSPEEAMEIVKKHNASPTVKILDESGEIGKLYDAKTTPHMFVIDKDGMLAYAGAIDDNSSPRHETVEGATNHVAVTIENLTAGNPITIAQTAPYGCSVKYSY